MCETHNKTDASGDVEDGAMEHDNIENVGKNSVSVSHEGDDDKQVENNRQGAEVAAEEDCCRGHLQENVWGWMDKLDFGWWRGTPETTTPSTSRLR